MRFLGAADLRDSRRVLSARPRRSEKGDRHRPQPAAAGTVLAQHREARRAIEYHARHVTYELDLLLELLDREKPQVIVNFAAQGEGAVSWKNSWRFFETNSMALARAG